MIVADGAAGAGNAQGQGSDFNTGEGIELKSAGFQGALIANHAIRNETTSKMQGPMISVYDGVFAGQSNDLSLPADPLRAVRRRRDHQRPAQAAALATPELRGG